MRSRSAASAGISRPGCSALAVVGAVLMTTTRFWRDPEFYLTFATFSVFFFYKTRIVAEHFWTSRRFVGVALPGALLLAMGALVDAGHARERHRRATTARHARASVAPAWRNVVSLIGSAVVAVLIGDGVLARRDAGPSTRGIRGAHPAARATGRPDRGSRHARSSSPGTPAPISMCSPCRSPTSTLATCSCSIRSPRRARRSRHSSPGPERGIDHVFFLGGGGTDLLTREISAAPVANDKFQVAEYDAPMNAYPSGARQKEFEYGLYELTPADRGHASGDRSADRGTRRSERRSIPRTRRAGRDRA